MIVFEDFPLTFVDVASLAITDVPVIADSVRCLVDGYYIWVSFLVDFQSMLLHFNDTK